MQHKFLSSLQVIKNFNELILNLASEPYQNPYIASNLFRTYKFLSSERLHSGVIQYLVSATAAIIHSI